MTDQNISIKISADKTNATQSLDEVAASLKKLETSAGGASAASNNFTKSTGGATTATQSAMASFNKLAGALGVTALAYQAFMKIVSELNQLIRDGFKAVEDYYTSIASLAAMVLTFTKAHQNMGLAERWKEALKYSTEMIPILENLAAKTLLSGQETTALANAFARAGVFLDATNAKQIESFTRLSNALPLMTQGQSIMLQINQEIRGLMGGGNMATSMLLQTLKSINPEIENQLKVWRAEGTVLEHLGDLLVGFGPATSMLENQWQAVKSTIDTTVTQTLRGGMEPVYKDIIGLVKNMDDGLIEHKGTISAGIVVAWNSVKNILAIVWNVIAGLKPLLEPLVALTGAIAYGWGGILAVLEPISKIIGNILSMGIEVVKVFGNAVLALGALINLQPEVAKVAANEAIKSAKQVKALAIESAGLFANGIGDSLVKYENQVQKAMTSGKNLAATNKYIFEPVTKGADEASEKVSKAAKEAQKLREEADKINETLGNDIKMSGLDDLEKKLFEIQIKYEKLGQNPLVDKGLLGQARGIEESDAKWAARSAELKKEAQLAQEATKAEEELIRNIQAGYDATMAGIKKQQDADEQLLRDKLELYKGLTGFENEYRQVQLDWIELIKNKEIQATGDVIAANAKAAKQIRIINEKKEEDDRADREASFRLTKDSFSAMAELYAKDTKERQVLSDISKAAAVAEIAVQVEKNLMIATGAVLNQATGDPYTAFARMAAMAAAVAGVLSGVGIAFGGVGGGGDTSPGASGPTYTGKSTVLGAADDVGSESISKSWELLQDTYEMEYHELRGIYNEMKNLNDNITGLVTSIIRTGVGQWPEINMTTIGTAEKLATKWLGGIGSLLGVTGGIIGKIESFLFRPLNDIVNAVFGGKTTTTSGASGITLYGGQAGAFQQGAGTGGHAWQDMYSTKSGGWFHSDKHSYWQNTAALDSSVVDLFSKVYQNLTDTLVELTIGFGQDITKTLAYVFPGGALVLNGLNAEQISETLMNYFSAQADAAVQTLFGTLLKGYQEVGESLMDTAVRIMVEKAIVMETLEKTNKAYIGSTENAIALSEALIKLAGDLETLTEIASTYYDKFFTDTEKQTRLQEQLAGVFEDMSQTLPATRAGYRAIVESLDLTTTSGQSAYITLLKLAESADAYYSTIEDLAEERANQEIELMEAQGKAEEVLAAKRAQELAAMDESLRPLQQLIWLTKDWADKISKANSEASGAISNQISLVSSAASASRGAADEYRNIIKSLSDAQESIRGGGAAETQQRFDTLFATAMTGDREALAALPGASEKLLSGSLATSQSAVDYARDQGKMLLALEQAKMISGAMVDWNEYHATLLETQVNILEEIQEELAKENPTLDVLETQAGLLESLGSLLQQQTTAIISGNQLLTDQTGKITIGNELTGEQITQVITGNKTQDVIKNISNLNTAYSEEMLAALIEGESARTNSLQEILAANNTTVNLIGQLVSLTQASEEARVKAAAQAAAAQAAAEEAQRQAAEAARIAAEKAAAEAALAAQEIAATAAYNQQAAAAESYRAQWDQFATSHASASFKETQENIASGTPYSVTGYYSYTDAERTWLSQTASAYQAAFAEAYKLWKAIPGHASGLSYVPQNDYLMRAHEGEAVLTKQEAVEWRGSKNGITLYTESNAALLAEIKKLNAKIDRLEATNDQAVRYQKTTADVLQRVTRDGESMLTEAA